MNFYAPALFMCMAITLPSLGTRPQDTGSYKPPIELLPIYFQSTHIDVHPEVQYQPVDDLQSHIQDSPPNPADDLSKISRSMILRQKFKKASSSACETVTRSFKSCFPYCTEPESHESSQSNDSEDSW